MQTNINTVKNRFSIGPDSCLPSQVVQFLYDNPSVAGPFFDLYSGDLDPPNRIVHANAEGGPIIDSFTVSAILDHNAFKPENAAHLVENPQTAARAKDPCSDAGIWVRASYLNHSCTANVLRACIGDFMILRAVRAVRKGEELLHSYVPTLNELPDRDKSLGKFGFTCLCELCEVQRATSEQEIERRQKAVKSFQKFERQGRETGLVRPGPLITQARKLLKAIRKTYSNPNYCIDLLKPYAFLFTLRYSAGRKSDGIADLQEIIRLVSGADISGLDKFEPDYFPPELIFFFFGLCIAFEDVGQTASVCVCH